MGGIHETPIKAALQRVYTKIIGTLYQSVFEGVSKHILIFSPTDRRVANKAPRVFVKPHLYRGFIKPNSQWEDMEGQYGRIMFLLGIIQISRTSQKSQSTNPTPKEWGLGWRGSMSKICFLGRIE